jgi:hypothetical protein
MEPSTLFAISVGGLILWAFILSNIISGATRSKQIEKHLRIQNELLSHIAMEQGVNEEVVKSIFNRNNY